MVEQLKVEQQLLRSRLDQMTFGQYRVHSLSESSTASTTSTASSSSEPGYYNSAYLSWLFKRLPT